MQSCRKLTKSSKPKFRELNNKPLEELKDTIDRCKIDIPLRTSSNDGRFVWLC